MAQYDESVTELAQELQEALVKARDRGTLSASDAVVEHSEALLAALGSPEEATARTALKTTLDAHPGSDEAGGVEPIALELVQVLETLDSAED